MNLLFKKIQSTKFNSLFFKLTIIFIMFFIIPVILASIVFYNYSTSIVENEVKNANLSLLRHACEMTDTKLSEVQRIVFELSGKSYVRKLSNPLFNQEESIELLSQTIDHLQNIKNTNDFIAGIYIYYTANDFFVSNGGKIDFDIYFKRDSNYEGYNSNYWREFFEDRHSFESLNTSIVNSYSIYREVEKTQNLVTIITTLPFDEDPKAIIGVQINENSLKEILNNIGLTKNGSIYIISRDRKAISHCRNFANFDISRTDNIGFLEDSKSGTYISRINGKYMISYVTSNYTGWNFVAEIPYAEISERSHIIKLVTFLICIFFMMIGVIMSLKVSKRVYSPIKDLVDRLHKDIGNNAELKKYSGFYEFGVISKEMDNIISSNTRLRNLLDKNIDGIRHKFFFDLINGHFHNAEFIKYKAEELGVSFKYKYYTVSALKLEFYKEAYCKFSLLEIENIRSGLSKIISATAEGENMIVYTLGTGEDSIILLINSQTDDISILKHVFNEITELLNYDNDLVRLSVSLTAFTEDISQSTDLYKDACKVLNYRVLNRRSQIIDLNNIEKLKESAVFYYPAIIEESIYNFMLAGNYEKALEQLYNIIDTNIENNLPHEFMKEVLVAILNTLIKALNGKNISLKDVYGTRTDFYDELRSFTCVDEIKEFFRFIYKRAGEYILDTKRSSNEKLLNDIVDYLNKNYDKDIYLELISKKVGASPKYISRFFKEQTGLNLIDYINKLRVQKAKEMLREVDSKVQEIFCKVGFGNVNSFIRTFKRYEGISPGQYKEHCK